MRIATKRLFLTAASPLIAAVSFTLSSSSSFAEVSRTDAAIDSNEPSLAGELQVSFDIKPTSCPNPVNPHPGLRMTGTFATAILGTEDVAASTLQPQSLVLVIPEGGGGRGAGTLVFPISTNIEDVATPLIGGERCECITDGPDGRDDLTVHFDRDEVFEAVGGFQNGDEIQICILGELLDGTPFRGCDCVFVVGPVPLDESSWGQIKGSYR